MAYKRGEHYFPFWDIIKENIGWPPGWLRRCKKIFFEGFSIFPDFFVKIENIYFSFWELSKRKIFCGALDGRKNFFEGFSIFQIFFVKIENIYFSFWDIIKENIGWPPGWLRRCKKFFLKGSLFSRFFL